MDYAEVPKPKVPFLPAISLISMIPMIRITHFEYLIWNRTALVRE